MVLRALLVDHLCKLSSERNTELGAYPLFNSMPTRASKAGTHGIL